MRRVATLVASGAPSAEVFAAVAAQVARVMKFPFVLIARYDDDGAGMTVVATASDRPSRFKAGTQWPLEGGSLSALVRQTGRPARIEDYGELKGPIAAEARDAGLKRMTGAPIVVDGRLWGLIATGSPEWPLPDDVEDQLAQFTELLATAIANSEAHEELHRLADEQAALRRVATLVAQGRPPAEVFETVVEEVGGVVTADAAALSRFETDDTVTIIGGWSRTGGYVAVGARHPLGKGTLASLVFETRGPGRIDSYAEASGSLATTVREDMGWRSAVGAPIIVGGRLWGVVGVGSTTRRPLPADTEARLAQFSELVATAIANAEGREELARLAEEQTALRRVATLVAEGASPDEVFAAVSSELGRLIPADAAALSRYGPKGTATTVGGWARTGEIEFQLGEAYDLEGRTLPRLVFETRRPARMESNAQLPGERATGARVEGLRSAVAAPIIVEGRLWGVIGVASIAGKPLPPDTEERLVAFTELAATAIANTESHRELELSRARIVATADATRRKIERDLHDGAQQQLVSLALQLRAAEATVPAELGEHRAELSRTVDGLANVLEGLREIALGIHPAILAEGGLGPALKTLARRSPIPVELELDATAEVPEPVQVTAYYVVSEALTNAAKHSEARIVKVSVRAQDRIFRVDVDDDGVGGADRRRGSGLVNLKDRAEAIGGKFSLESPPNRGTALHVELPLASTRSPSPEAGAAAAS